MIDRLKDWLAQDDWQMPVLIVALFAGLPALGYVAWAYVIPFLCELYGFFMAGAEMRGWWAP